MEDAQIIELYLSRSESAITETARKYGHYLQQISYNILRSQEDTDEIIADAYLAAWNSIPPEMPQVLKHYLSRIVRNLSFSRLDYLTAKCRDSHMILLLSELEACIPDHKGNVEEHLEAKRAGEALNRFLSQLERQDCAVLLCRYYHSMTIAQIAQKYGLTERNVKYRLSRTRQQLRKFLDKEGICV